MDEGFLWWLELVLSAGANISPYYYTVEEIAVQPFCQLEQLSHPITIEEIAVQPCYRNIQYTL